MCKVCGFTVWSGEIRVKSKQPQEEKKETDVGERVVLCFGFRTGVGEWLPEAQQEMQCFIGSSIESVWKFR